MMIRTELILPIHRLLEKNAVDRPDKIAFVDGLRRVTYYQLFERTENLAGNLRSLGMIPNSTVGIYMNNSVSYIESCLAVTRAGGISVCVGAQTTESEAKFIFLDADVSVIITDSEHLEAVSRISGSIPAVSHIIVDGSTESPLLSYEDLAGNKGSLSALDNLPMNVPAWILYTSGTTRQPKGVLLSQHSMMWVVAAAWVPILGMTADDYVLCPLPLTHSYPFDAFLATIAVGASEYVMKRFSTKEVWVLLKEAPFTIIHGVPTIFAYLIQGGEPGGTLGKRMRMCISAGAILSANLSDKFEQTFGVPLLDVYGATEASTAITINSLHGTRIPGSCGIPVPGLAVRLVDTVTGKDVDSGTEGELIVRGPSVMLGYHNRAEETKEAIRDGWYYTGDLAKFDENAYITITGRVKDIIIRGGENIAPAEIEGVVIGHPEVLDCAVVAKSHDRLGEVPVLFVVLRDVTAGVNTDELLNYCREQLAPYKIPSEVYFVGEIPKTGSGKIMRFKLQKQLPVT